MGHVISPINEFFNQFFDNAQMFGLFQLMVVYMYKSRRLDTLAKEVTLTQLVCLPYQ